VSDPISDDPISGDHTSDDPISDDRIPDPKESKRAFWRLVATTSSLGWSLVLPIAGGALLGNYLDSATDQGFKWTVGLLFAGVAMSLYNLYHILYKETIE